MNALTTSTQSMDESDIDDVEFDEQGSPLSLDQQLSSERQKVKDAQATIR